MLRYFLIEEYRRHTYIAKKYSLVVFPLYVLFFTLLGSIFIDEVFEVMPYRTFIELTLISTFMYGFGVGSFEFLGRTMEKFTLVNTYSILPISAKKTYFYAFLRDTVYYSLLFVLPTYAGLLIATIFTKLTLPQVSLFTLTMLTSMLLGYSIAYTSFAIYNRSKVVYAFFVTLVFSYLLLAYLHLLPFYPAMFQLTKEYVYLLYSYAAIVLFTFAGYYFTSEKREYEKREHRSSFHRYMFLFRDPVFAKEMMDVIRGHIILKSTLTYFLPMVLIFIFVQVLNKVSSSHVYSPISLTIMLSIFSTVVYSWLTIMDDPAHMGLLPLAPWDIIKAHMKAHILIVSIVSVPVVVFINIGNMLYLIPAFALFYLNVGYLLSITAYLAGYRVTSMLFDPEIIIKFSLLSVVPGIILTISSLNLGFISVAIIVSTALIMLAISAICLKKAKKKWMYFD